MGGQKKKNDWRPEVEKSPQGGGPIEPAPGEKKKDKNPEDVGRLPN